MLYVLLTLWLVYELKQILFWLYLWQLKEYHTGRVMDHFQTQKGKQLLFNARQAVKLTLILVLLLFNDDFFIYVYYALFIAYVLEAGFFARNAFGKSLMRPRLTKKIVFLFFISCAILGVFILLILGQNNSSQIFWILLADVLTFAGISLVVLLFQPFFATARNFILGQAKVKMKKMKSVSGLRVVAVTGSYGKTSTKEFLATILSKKYRVLSTKEHKNSEIGVARTILDDLKPSHQIFIVEVGAYNKGKVAEVCCVIGPEIGIVTGVNEQHLALFGSMKNLLSAEGGEELADSLPKDGMLVVNGDNKHCLDLLKKNNNLPPGQEKIYAVENKSANADVWAESIFAHENYVSFLAMDKKGNLANFEAKVLGRQNVQNFLGAILVANELGISFGEISEAVKNIRPWQAGMVLMQGKHGINVIDSSYSANPDGVLADLDYLSVFSQKKVIIMPCLIELGPKSTEIHEKLGRKIGEICDLAIITSKDKFEKIKKGAMSAGMKEKSILLCDNPRDIFSTVTSFCRSGDAILLEGRVPGALLNLLLGLARQ